MVNKGEVRDVDMSQNKDLDAPIEGHVKWFDATKGFGFVTLANDGPDILLHANVLRNFGRSSVVDGARVILRAQKTDRGYQAVEVLAIEASPSEADASSPAALPDLPDATDLPLVAARVKWFDKGKGFGFANVFGHQDDVFIHAEVLRRSGFAELQPGEAVAIKVVDGPRGKMAADVRTWDHA